MPGSNHQTYNHVSKLNSQKMIARGTQINNLSKQINRELKKKTNKGIKKKKAIFSLQPYIPALSLKNPSGERQPYTVRADKCNLTGRRWEALNISSNASTWSVRFPLWLQLKGKLAPTCNPGPLGWMQTSTLPPHIHTHATPDADPQFGNIPTHAPCLLLSRKAIASQGTLQQLNRNTDPRRGGHENGGGHTHETQEFLRVTPANPPVQRDAFHRKTEGKARTKPVRSPPSTHCLHHPSCPPPNPARAYKAFPN